MLKRIQPSKASPETDPTPSRSKKNRQLVTGATVLLSTALLATGVSLLENNNDDPKKVNNTPGKKVIAKGNPLAEILKHDIANAYIPGSIRLTDAKATGLRPLLSNHAPDREIVTAHIDSEVGKAKQFLTIDGDPLPPKEVVTDQDDQTRAGVVNWSEYPSNGDINMEVQLDPYLGEQSTSRKYRLFLTAVDPEGNNGTPIAAEFYAGTVNISGSKGLINSVEIEREDTVPEFQLTYPQDPSMYYGPDNSNPNNG